MSDFAEIDKADEGTQEERIAWLRKRGVQIEIPGEAPPPALLGGATTSITLTLVPADDAAPIREIALSVGMSQGDQVLVQLRPMFASAGREIDTG